MKKLYFISDVHLAFSENNEEQMKRKKLLEFLNFINNEQTEALYILGDLFDFWYEWYHVIPKYWFKILCKFRGLVDSGIKVNFITGNHDFLISEFLIREVGINCFDEKMEFIYDQKQFFCGHGDGYAKMDRGYRVLKRFIRNPVSRFLFKTFVPADLGMMIARVASKSSREYLKKDITRWRNDYIAFAENKFSQGYDFVLLGHLHKPFFHETGGKIYLNCGNWIYDFSYALYDGDTLQLNRWSQTGENN